MRFRLIIFLIISVTGFSGCIKRDNSGFTDIPIIESHLRPGDYLNLTVSRQIPFSSNVNYSADDLNSLTITVTCNNLDYILTPLGDGKYIDSTCIVSEGERYDMSFNYNSMNISAYTEVPLKPSGFSESATTISVMRMDSTFTPSVGGWQMPDPLILTWDNDDASYYIVVVENMEEILDPIRDFGDNEPRFGTFRKMPTTSAGIEMRPQEFQYFGHHRIILYHVLPDYASLYDETTTSSLNLTNPSTSIKNGYGIFTGLNADTLYLNVKELK
jgi:hypothetical protein